MTTVLSLAQDCARRLGLPTLSTLVGNTSNNAILLKNLMEETAQYIRSIHEWPELQKEYTFTLATSTASYALPTDYDRRIDETEWNRTQTQPLYGPLNPVQWQEYKSGVISSFPNERFRVKGFTLTQFFIDPTPTSDLDGQTCVYEYISKHVFRPKTWVASTSWSGVQYCFYNGNLYDRGATSALSTGTTAPTHTSGAVSDGTITWTYYNTPYETIVHDTDQYCLDDQVFKDNVIWRFKREMGLFYEEERADAEALLELAKTKLSGAPIVVIQQGDIGPNMLGLKNYPVSDF